LYPTTFEELLGFQLSVTLCCGGALPVPLTARIAGEFEASLTKLRFPDAAPDADGVNVAVNDAEVPAVMVLGKLMPLTENSLFVVPIDVTVTELPLAVSVPVKLWFSPTTTLLKVIGFGETASCPGAAPVPLRFTDNEGFDPFDTTASDPLATPPDCGANVTLNVAPCPGLNVTGGFTPVMLKPVPVGVIEEIVTAVPPLLLSVSDSVLLDPVATLPKVRLGGFALTAPGETPVADKAML
jgi:hypothetical protein